MNKKIIVLVFVLLFVFAGKLIAEENTNKGKNYKYIAPINVVTSNKLINGLIENNWDCKYLKKIFGEPDSFFLGYNLYFYKGMEVRVGETNDRIFNIVFTDRYSDDVLENINLNSNEDEIVKKLGSPQFEDKKYGVTGYKTKNFYIFFVGDNKFKQVSIYGNNSNYDKTLIKGILSKIEGKGKNNGRYNDLYDIIRSIKSEWTDFDFNYSIRNFGSYVVYATRGIFLSFENYKFLITIKGNFIGELTDNISLPDKTENLKNFDNPFVSLELGKDFIFESELGRWQRQEELKTANGALSPDGTKKIIRLNSHDDGITNSQNCGAILYYGFGYESTDNGIQVYYVNKDKHNAEIMGSVAFDCWLNSRYFIYTGFGIYIWDTLKNNKIKLDNNVFYPESSFKLVSFRDGKIVYEFDGRTYTQYYTFDQDGNIIIKTVDQDGKLIIK